MGLTAYVFPGQGAQSVGMGADICRQHEGAQALFRAADETLGYPLSELIFQGPEDELKLTYHTQPALLTTSCAYLERLRDSGHSAGLRRRTQPWRIQRSRMRRSDVLYGCGAHGAPARGIHGPGGACRPRCDGCGPGGRPRSAGCALPGSQRAGGSCGDGECELPGADRRLGNGGGRAGGRRTGQGDRCEAGRPLEVSGPFHSSLMEPAASRLREVLQQVEMRDAEIPVIANVTAGPVTKAEEIRELLVRQVVSPVLWEDSDQLAPVPGRRYLRRDRLRLCADGSDPQDRPLGCCHTVNSVESLEAAIDALKNRDGK